MNILGIGDGLDAGAALIVDDHVVACAFEKHFNQVSRSRAFPWRAIEGVLQEGKIAPGDVDVVAVAGRFSPPFFLRRHPGLRAIARDPFSPALDMQVFYQAILRQTGMGAFEADRTAEWFEKRLLTRGIDPQRVNMVDVHTALAEGAYRSQPEDDVLVVVLHPMGDGVSCSVHRGRFGQLDRVWEQRGFATLHVHLQRCAHAIGHDVVLASDTLWSMAARGEPDSNLVSMLRRLLTVEGDRLSRRSYPLPVSPQDEVYDALRRAPVEVAAASVLRNLEDAVMALLTHHVMTWRCRNIVLAGAVFENSRLLANIMESEIASYVRVPSLPGWGLLPFGAAATESGVTPRKQGSYIGLSWPEQEILPNGTSVTSSEMAKRLMDGAVVMRCAARDCMGRSRAGTRSLLVSVDALDSLTRILGEVGYEEGYEPCILVREGTAGFESLAAHGEASRIVSALPSAAQQRCSALMGGDGRAHVHLVPEASDPFLYATLKSMSKGRRTGILASFRLPEGDISSASSVVALWDKHSCIDGLLVHDRVRWRTEA